MIAIEDSGGPDADTYDTPQICPGGLGVWSVGVGGGLGNDFAAGPGPCTNGMILATT